MDDVGVVSQTTRPLDPSFGFASTMGLSSERMQVMKASFFDLDSVPSELPPKPHPMKGKSLLVPSLGSVTAGYTESRIESHDHLFPRPKIDRCPQSPSVFTQSPYGDEATLFRPRVTIASKRLQPQTSTVPRPKTHSHSAPLAQPCSLIPRHSLDYVPSFDKSILDSNSTRLCKDDGLFLGRSFRVGWGINWNFVHSGCKVSKAPVAVLPRPPQGLFNPASNSVEGGEFEGLKIRVVREKVDASPWMKPGLIADEEKKKVTKYFIYCLLCFVSVNIVSLHHVSVIN